MTVLEVRPIDEDKIEIAYPTNHPRVKDIERWLGYGLSAGYIEYLLKTGNDPHCSACRDFECENQGMGDDACRGFKYGEAW